MSYKSSSTLNDCTSLPEAPMPEKMQKVWPSPTSMAQSARSMSHARHRRLPEPTAGEQRSLRLPRSRSDVCSSSGQHFDSVLSDPVVPAASHRDIGSSIDSVGALRCNSPPMQPRPPTPETMEWVSSGGFWMDCSYLIDCAQVVESLPDRFTCQVCGMLDLNVLDPKCGGHHPFCRSCLHDWHQRCVSKGEPVLCPTCQREISRSEWALQTDATELRELQVECPECEAEGVTFQCAFKDLPTHWRSGTCAGSLVACPLKDAGCRYTCVESLAHEHRVLEQESHLKLLMSAFSGGKETALKLEAELRRERDAADCLRRQLQSSNPLSYCLATQVPLPFLVSFGPARYSSLVDVHYFCTETSSWVPAAKYGFQQSPLNKPHPSTADSKVLFTVVPFSGRLAAWVGHSILTQRSDSDYFLWAAHALVMQMQS
ncbi:MAG: hypothetical protein KVP17_000594 [Porospora cf. gigantea B]|uniref:uncharacterized protein n=1 Tax=Porospora cf. gigantea B TaxID=2853592 RepID=UPI003571C82A|nr:MAG: hypothetical protein KVP17_000594 [Porospora cf. gigantea B]